MGHTQMVECAQSKLWCNLYGNLKTTNKKKKTTHNLIDNGIKR